MSAAAIQTAQAALARGDHAAARDALAPLAESGSGDVDVLGLLGVARIGCGDAAGAIVALRRATDLAPGNYLPWMNLGVALRKQGDFAGAEAAYLKAREAGPGHWDVYRNLGFLYRYRGRLDEAIACYRQGLALAPQEVDLHFNLALALLMAGRDAEAWPEYEWRLKMPLLARTPRAAPWRGESLAGRRLRVWAEQGYGDVLQFARYLPLLRERGAELVIEAQPALHDLLAESFSAQAEAPGRGDAAACDYEVPLLSLPLRLDVGNDRLGARVPYLSALARRQSEWRARRAALPAGGRRRCVALVWQGNRANGRDGQRSLSPQALLPLLAVADTDFVSLQRDEAEAVAWLGERGVADWGSHIRDFADAAAALTTVDLLICVETAYTHLAGALGVPTWAMVPYAHDWRWGLSGEHCDWYPSLRLWRAAPDQPPADLPARLAAALAGAQVAAAAAADFPPAFQASAAMVSYTRNFEDVIVNRVFHDVERGYYVDVGASHPEHDSNTCALYRRGWRGLAVEAQAEQAAAWAAARPEDAFVAAACGAADGEAVLHCPPAHGQCATVDAATAAFLNAHGVGTEARRVAATTLDSLLARHRPAGPIHLLSIDVEGAEAAVLTGLDLGRFRPWLLLVEATRPGTPTQTHAAWEPSVLAAGYRLAYCDGVNRFYVAAEHAGRLLPRLRLPPNVWDNFMPAREAALQARVRELENRLAQYEKTYP